MPSLEGKRARYIKLRKESLLDELGKHAATIKGSKKEIAKLKEEASSIFWVSVILYGITGWVLWLYFNSFEISKLIISVAIALFAYSLKSARNKKLDKIEKLEALTRYPK